MSEELESKFEKRKYSQLVLSIILDLLGCTSYLIPILGEGADLIFAPFYALAIFGMYRMKLASASTGAVGGFIEEILPGTDIIPTATLLWVYTYILREESSFDAFIDVQTKREKKLEKYAEIKRRRNLN